MRILIALLWISVATAGPKSVPQERHTSQSAPSKQTPEAGKRSRDLNLEDELVEGVQRNPFDSVTNVRSDDMKGTMRLYRVKGKYTLELKLNSAEAAFSQ